MDRDHLAGPRPGLLAERLDYGAAVQKRARWDEVGSRTMLGSLVTVMFRKKHGRLSEVVRRAIVAAVIGASCCPLIVRAQDQEAQVQVLQIRPNFYMIAGAGGNIGVQIGDDGIVLVDTGSAAMSDQVSAAIRNLTSTGVTYTIDTSDDADDIGGN